MNDIKIKKNKLCFFIKPCTLNIPPISLISQYSLLKIKKFIEIATIQLEWVQADLSYWTHSNWIVAIEMKQKKKIAKVQENLKEWKFLI